MYDFRKILDTGYNNVAPKAGRVLLSMPFVDDAYFRRSAIFLVEHNDEGSLGFMLDKVLPRSINYLLNEIKNFNAQIFVGGPVEQDRLNFLHTQGHLIENSVQIIPGLWLGGNLDNVIQLINDELITENDIRFFIGYSGWSNGQLNDELKRDSWVVSKLTINEIFTVSPDKLWQRGLKHLGGKYAYWDLLPLNPELN